MRLFRLALLVSTCQLLLAGSAPAADATPELPDAKLFFRRADIAMAEISPTGEHLAMVVRSANGRNQLAIISTAPDSTDRYVTGFEQADIVRLFWISPNRLIAVTDDLSGQESHLGFHRSAFAINADGSDAVMLIDGSPGFSQDHLGATLRSTILPGRYGVRDLVYDGSDDVIVAEYRWNRATGDVQNVVPYRLNTHNRVLTTLVDKPLPARAQYWLFDADAAPRLFESIDAGRRRVYYRDASNWNWRQIGDFDAYNGEGYHPAFFGPDGTLYVIEGAGGAPSALYRFDLQNQRVSADPVMQLEGFDYDAVPEVDRRAKKILGFHFRTDAHGSVWLDPRRKAVQEKVDKALPATSNIISCHNCRDPKYLLVAASSDREPTHYLLFDVASEKLLPVAAARNGIDAARMGRRDFFRYTTRDGLSIPVYVTMPPGKRTGPLPTVVLVHGGPWARGDSWEWAAIPQFLATRGYAVIEPEFRGSVGFGFKLFQAGWRQMGLAMQDDIADATKWAIAKGVADPSRIAISGASYGGYATLMGLVRNPELFRCGFEWVGVTDFGLLHDYEELDSGDEWVKYGWPRLVGDNDDAVPSPVKSVARITQPILMAYGRLDRIVPIEQGHKFRDAVTAGNHKVEYIEYPHEGHGWYIEDDNIDFWRHVEKFLQENLRDAK